MKNFVTVSTNAARCQDVSLNPQKLAGQCAKLKCCLNYEVSVYTEAAAKLPPRDVVLETEKATYYFFKSDIIAGLVTYSTDKHLALNTVTITAEHAKEIALMNREGRRPEDLKDINTGFETPSNVDLATQDSLTRFDKRKKKKNRHHRSNNQQQGERRNAQGGGDNEQRQPRDNRRNRQRRNRPDGPRREHHGEQNRPNNPTTAGEA
jgi:hypothetical protein